MALFFLVFLFFPGTKAVAASATASAVVERSTVFEGEPFTFQIQVSGSEKPEKPDLSGIKEFDVNFRGGQRNSSRSMTIVNGRVTQDTRYGYVFEYQLVPKHSGRLTIPAIKVEVEGKTVWTNPVGITVEKPSENDDFKLRLQLSKSRCYVGEPVVLTGVLYLAQSVKGFNMSLPLLNEKDTFYFSDPHVDTSTGSQFYRIPLGDGEVIGEKGQGRMDGKEFATITFKKILIPRKAGKFSIGPATAACEALAGYKKARNPFGNDFFSNFFNDDFFGGHQQGIYRKVVIPSNELVLSVSDVPTEGRPSNYEGPIGEYKIRAEATPTEISVGDPITLKITLSGPDYLEHVNLPPLSRQQNLRNSFKIPQERAVGEMSGNTKVFTQTIRALTPNIKEIPPIELPYFDTRSGTYQIARTGAIPIFVKAAKIVTASDAEGAAEKSVATNELETWTKGIAYNYEDSSVLENQSFGPVSWFVSPVGLCGVIGFPMIYMLLLVSVRAHRKMHSDPLSVMARKAFRKLSAELRKVKKIESEQKAVIIILDALRMYLGEKLRVPYGRALTYNDIKSLLVEQGIASDTLDRLRFLFDQCDAGRYAGARNINASELVRQAFDLAKAFEKKLK